MVYDLSNDNPVEVTEKQYSIVTNIFKGVIAHRKDTETGKYYIKLWYQSDRPKLEAVLIALE